MAFLTGDIVPLNRTEHGYAAIEGLAATMVQPYLIRLDGPVDVTAVRRVMRELVTAYPKLRAKLEPVVAKHGAAISATVAEVQAELAKLRK